MTVTVIVETRLIKLDNKIALVDKTCRIIYAVN